jgi:hypothetical protein
MSSEARALFGFGADWTESVPGISQTGSVAQIVEVQIPFPSFFSDPNTGHSGNQFRKTRFTFGIFVLLFIICYQLLPDVSYMLSPETICQVQLVFCLRSV